MNIGSIIPSALLAISVFLLAFFGHETIARLVTRLVRKDRDRYAQWGHELFLGWSADQFRRAAFWAKASVLLALPVVYFLTGSVVFAIVIAIAVYFAPKVAFRLSIQKRRDQLDEQLPDAVDVMVASVRAGCSLPQALTDVSEKMFGPASQELQLIVTEYERGGMSMETALERARDRVRLESFTLIASALMISLTQGGELLSILERISEALRELLRLKHKIFTETSEVRAQEKIILFLTPLFGGMICMFDPDIPRLLFQTIPGNLLLVVVVGIQAVSVYWIRRILRSTI